MPSVLDQSRASTIGQVADRHRSNAMKHLCRWLIIGLLALGLWVPLPEAAEIRIDPSEVATLLPRDAIPAIRDPKPLLVPADAAKGVRDTDQVVGVAIGGESRAYPIPFLSWHEIVNDMVGGVPLAATW